MIPIRWNLYFRDQIKAFIKADQDELVLPRCNGFLRLLIYQLVKEDFDSEVNIKTKSDNRDRVIVITKFKSIEDQRTELEKLIEEEEQELDNTIGFTKVIKFLLESVSFCINLRLIFFCYIICYF